MRLDLRELAAVFAGGFAGTVVRAAAVDRFPIVPGAWPWATLVVNIVGAFLLGYAVTRLDRRVPEPPYRRSLVGAGLCAGLTTFSAFQIEVLWMLDAGRAGLAGAYLAVSVGVGLAAVVLATRLARTGGAAAA